MKKRVAVCPISHRYIDENVARLNCFSSLLLVIIGWHFNIVWLFLLIDFFLRSFKIEFSLVSRLNQLLVSLLKIKKVRIDIAPKEFASKIGLIMTILIILFHYLQLLIPLYFSFGFLIFATSLASFFNYCLGCKIYGLLAGFGIIKLK